MKPAPELDSEQLRVELKGKTHIGWMSPSTKFDVCVQCGKAMVRWINMVRKLEKHHDS